MWTRSIYYITDFLALPKARRTQGFFFKLKILVIWKEICCLFNVKFCCTGHWVWDFPNTAGSLQPNNGVCRTVLLRWREDKCVLASLPWSSFLSFTACLVDFIELGWDCLNYLFVLLLLSLLSFALIFLYVCGAFLYGAHVEVRGQIEAVSSLIPSYWVPGIELIIRPDGSHFYLLNHLAGPSKISFFK